MAPRAQTLRVQLTAASMTTLCPPPPSKPCMSQQTTPPATMMHWPLHAKCAPPILTKLACTLVQNWCNTERPLRGWMMSDGSSGLPAQPVG